MSTGKPKKIEGLPAGTYYLVCKDAVGNISTNNPSAVFASYVVENRLLELKAELDTLKKEYSVLMYHTYFKKNKYDEENYTRICDCIVKEHKELMTVLLNNVSTDKKNPLTLKATIPILMQQQG